MSEQSFMKSPLKKVLKLVDIFCNEMKMQYANGQSYQPGYFDSQEISVIQSMREVEGFTNGI